MKAPQRIEPDDDAIILSVRLKSGKFESSIEVPLFATKDEMDAFTSQWLLMMEAGVKVGSARRKQNTEKG